MLKCTGQWCLVVSLMTLSLVIAMPATTPTTTSTTSRTNVSPIGDTLKQLADQLMNLNATSHITFDTRTPPKFREQTRKDHAEVIELFGHPGIAEAVDEEAILMEEENKKMNFYKVDKSTTDSGLSTWILLSGQSSTNKPTKKPVVTLKNATTTEDKIIKPIFKRKTTTPLSTSVASTTRKPTTLVSTTLKATIATSILTTDKPEKTTKLSKVKASSTTKTTVSPKKTAGRSTTSKPTKTTSKSDLPSSISATTPKSEFVKVPTKNSNNSNSTELKPEAKDGTLDLTPSGTDKKSKRPTSLAVPKRKKNKIRRKKPVADDKVDIVNGTKLVSKNKDKPIGTQLYNYLSREVMPTVGVGLVGLMVTAGLASYFLYPFGPLRRSYDVDRKDKEGAYHYTDEYSGGIAEEDAIGKVIAGMPSNSNNYNNNNNVNANYNVRSQNSRNTYGNGLNEYNSNMNSGYQPNNPNANTRFRNVEQRYSMEGTVEHVALNPMTAYRTEEVIIGSPKKNTYSNHKETYDNFDKPGPGKESVSIINDDQFVVGNVPQEITQVPTNQGQPQATTETATPAIVPEHGPRTLEEITSEDDHQQEKVFVVESVPAHSEALYSIEHGPRRRKRQVRKIDNKADKEIDNEIDVDNRKEVHTNKEFMASTTSTTSTSTVNTLVNSDSTKDTIYDTTTTDGYEYYTSVNPIVEKTESIFSLIKDLIYMKVRLGLQLLQDKAESLSRYFKTVQRRIDVTYKNVNQTQTQTISYS